MSLLPKALAFPLTLLVAACGATGANIGPDPVALRELGGLGGGSYQDLTVDQIAAASGLMLEVEVIEVRPSRLNTADGRFPSAEEIESFGLSSLEILTDVEVRVVAVLATDGAGEPPKPGDNLVVTVGGGSYPTILDSATASALGVGPPEGGAAPAGQDVPFTYGSSPDHDLAEGDHVVIFLSRIEIGGFAGADSQAAWVPTHPAGIFYAWSGGWYADRGFTARVPVERLVPLVAG